MSILLEALRKSEKNQHPHEVPTIHSDDQSGPVSESLKIGPLALLLIVALFTSGWFVWRQYQAPTGIYQPPVTLAVDKSRVTADPVKKPQTESGGNSQPKVVEPVTDNTAAQKRTPVESYTQPVASDSQLQAGDARTTSTNSQANSGAGGNSAQPTSTGTGSENTAAAPVQRDPRQPAPISYWELPDAIRASVPEIKFSVLVYARNPDDRFVLINGQRLGEGDSLQSGPVVKEIQREGVIFSYRLYQFLVER